MGTVNIENVSSDILLQADANPAGATEHHAPAGSEASTHPRLHEERARRDRLRTAAEGYHD